LEKKLKVVGVLGGRPLKKNAFLALNGAGGGLKTRAVAKEGGRPLKKRFFSFERSGRRAKK
jgi:hypothetical protein